jgi:hypothetical protein
MRSWCVFIATLFWALIAPALGVARERINICAQFSATGQTYRVIAISTNGPELNETTDSLKYNLLSSYIVISWAEDRTTVIEMDGPFSGPTYVQTRGTDQEGHLWEISAYSPWRVSEAHPHDVGSALERGHCAAQRGCPLRAKSRLMHRRKERPYSITSSARLSSAGGTVRPSAFAVLRLMMSSNLVGSCTGRSAGFSPLRIRPR